MQIPVRIQVCHLGSQVPVVWFQVDLQVDLCSALIGSKRVQSIPYCILEVSVTKIASKMGQFRSKGEQSVEVKGKRDNRHNLTWQCHD